MTKKAFRLISLIRHGRADVLFYRLRNLANRVDLEPRSAESLGLSPSQSAYYSDSGPDLYRLMKLLRAKAPGHALDLGSGKGGAAFTLSRFGFQEVVGVEISPELVRVAEENARRLGVRNVRFVCRDAAAFVDLDPFTWVYMYNPFRAVVLAKVLSNLRDSLLRVPREMALIYLNPRCHEVVENSGLFGAHTDYSFQPYSMVFRVYLHAAT